MRIARDSLLDHRACVLDARGKESAESLEDLAHRLSRLRELQPLVVRRIGKKDHRRRFVGEITEDDAPAHSLAERFLEVSAGESLGRPSDRVAAEDQPSHAVASRLLFGA